MENIVALNLGGHIWSLNILAEIFKINRSTLSRVIRKHKSSENIRGKKHEVEDQDLWPREVASFYHNNVDVVFF